MSSPRRGRHREFLRANWAWQKGNTCPNERDKRDPLHLLFVVVVKWPNLYTFRSNQTNPQETHTKKRERLTSLLIPSFFFIYFDKTVVGSKESVRGWSPRPTLAAIGANEWIFKLSLVRKTKRSSLSMGICERETLWLVSTPAPGMMMIVNPTSECTCGAIQSAWGILQADSVLAMMRR